MRFSVKFKGGTTEAIAIASIVLKSKSASANKLRTCTPHSSPVRARAVVRRQSAINFSSSNTPSDVFVFPTSITSSILNLFSRNHPQELFNFIGGRACASFLANQVANFGGAFRITWVIDQSSQFTSRRLSIVTRPRQYSAATQSHNSCCIIKLIMRVRQN